MFTFLYFSLPFLPLFLLLSSSSFLTSPFLYFLFPFKAYHSPLFLYIFSSFCNGGLFMFSLFSVFLLLSLHSPFAISLCSSHSHLFSSLYYSFSHHFLFIILFPHLTPPLTPPSLFSYIIFILPLYLRYILHPHFSIYLPIFSSASSLLPLFVLHSTPLLDLTQLFSLLFLSFTPSAAYYLYLVSYLHFYSLIWLISLFQYTFPPSFAQLFSLCHSSKESRRDTRFCHGRGRLNGTTAWLCGELCSWGDCFHCVF